MTETKTKLLPVPSELKVWLTKKQRSGETARMLATDDPEMTVDLKTAQVVGKAPNGKWEGKDADPLWCGYPFVPHREREAEDDPGLYIHETPRKETIADVSVWRVAEDPSTHCGVFLRADVYEVNNV